MLPDTFFAYISNDSFFSMPNKDAYLDSKIDISIALKLYMCFELAYYVKKNQYDNNLCGMR